MPFPALISAQQLAALLQDQPPEILLLDCRYALTDPTAGAAAYAQAHIPGAIHADLGKQLSGTASSDDKGGRHPLPEPQVFAKAMAALGARDDSLVVAYDAGESVFAARLWWLMRWIGHDKVCVLDGGLQAWVDAGGELVADQPTLVPGKLSVRASALQTVSYAQVLANIEAQERVVLDARAADRYRGENETMDPIGGRIPGARNRPYKDNLDASGRFKPAEQLRSEFQAILGDTPASQIIHQCGSGVSACHNLLAMNVAGFGDSTLYPGSWSEWSRQADAPIARG